MFTESVEVYDLIYSGIKDYAEECARLAALLRRVHPSCRTILDVACGSGEHVRRLVQDHGFQVDGLDLDPRFVAVASRKNPRSRIFPGDMAGFYLGERYDAVVCLFSSIGYLRTLPRVSLALACFKRHLAAGGVIIVEPWFAPGQLDPGYVMRNSAEAEGLHVERVSHTEIDGRLSRLRFDYTLTDASGVRTAAEVHELGLFTPAEMLGAFEAMGLDVEYDPIGLDGRGLYVARVVD
jgi:SAM-dependent methyltransferase